jgi:processing peptidase subunit alpha
VTVVSENSALPGTVTFKVLLDVGTRNETNETSGALLNIKNSYLKTVLNTNETVNYGMVQMSGGRSNMKYNQETTLFSASCLSHDGVDIFGMIADCALEPRSVVAANVGIQKSKHSHSLEKIHGSGIEFNDTLFRTAYGLKGLGMPLLGLESNVDYLNAVRIQQFQMENIAPERIFIGGAGVQNHEEFVELVQDKLKYINKLGGKKTKAVQPSEYIGGTHIATTSASDANVALVYEAPSWKDKDAITMKVAAALLGSYSSANSETGISPSSRLYRNIMSSKAFVTGGNIINYTFSDSGLFGLRLTGSASHAAEIYEQLQRELNGLADNITDEELEGARSLMMVNILSDINKPSHRLSESLRNLRVGIC